MVSSISSSLRSSASETAALHIPADCAGQRSRSLSADATIWPALAHAIQIAEIKFLRSLNHPQLPNLADRLNAQKSSSARSRRKANSASPAIADSSRAYYRTLNTLTKLQAARQKQTQASGPQEERPPKQTGHDQH